MTPKSVARVFGEIELCCIKRDRLEQTLSDRKKEGKKFQIRLFPVSFVRLSARAGSLWELNTDAAQTLLIHNTTLPVHYGSAKWCVSSTERLFLLFWGCPRSLGRKWRDVCGTLSPEMGFVQRTSWLGSHWNPYNIKCNSIR